VTYDECVEESIPLYKPLPLIRANGVHQVIRLDVCFCYFNDVFRFKNVSVEFNKVAEFVIIDRYLCDVATCGNALELNDFACNV